MLPWAEMMRMAVQAGIAPAGFWQLSLREWRWLLPPLCRGLDQADLTQLIKDYPDGPD